jgi:hypothetical protein
LLRSRGRHRAREPVAQTPHVPHRDRHTGALQQLQHDALEQPILVDDGFEIERLLEDCRRVRHPRAWTRDGLFRRAEVRNQMPQQRCHVGAKLRSPSRAGNGPCTPRAEQPIVLAVEQAGEVGSVGQGR